MKKSEKYIELSKKIENDKEFDNWIQYMDAILQDESKSDEVDDFFYDDLNGVLFEKSVVTNPQKRKKVFDLAKKLYEYFEKKQGAKFKYITYESMLENSFDKNITRGWDECFDAENMSNEELDDLLSDYFNMIDDFNIDHIPFYENTNKFKGFFEKTKLYKNLKTYILNKNNCESRKVSAIENIIYYTNKRVSDGKTNILDSIQPVGNEKGELLIALKTRDIVERLRKFCEEADDISDNDRNAIKDYFENYFAETIKLASKYPEVLKIASFAERICKVGYYNPTANRMEMYDYLEEKYEELGNGIIQNINIEKIKEGDRNAERIATQSLEVLTEGFTFYSEIVDGFNFIKAAGIDYIETDVYRKFSENTYSILFDEITEKRKNGNKKYEEEEEEDPEVKKIEDFFVTSQRELIGRKPNIFSREGISINNILNVHNISEKEDEDLGFYALVKERYDIDNIDLEREKKLVEEYIKSNDIVENQDEFDAFLIHLQNVKLKEEGNKLPMKYIKYILKQGLEDSTVSRNQEKYKYLMECIILDFARNDLPKKIQKNKPYAFQILDNLGRNIENGSHNNNGYIRYRRANIREIFSIGNLDFINTIFHENVHASQYYDFENTENRTISYNRYVMEKEEILMRLMPTFYASNYDKTFIEIEANEKAAQKIIGFLNSFYPNESRDKKIKYTTLGENLNHYSNVLNDKKNAYITSESVQVNDKDKNVYELFDEEILKNPEYLERYPDLLLEYNSDGTPKTFEELLNQGMMAEKTDEKYLMAKIINKSQRMNYKNFSNEMNALMKCFTLDGYENSSQNALVGNAFLKKIVIENVGNIANQISDNIEAMSQSELLQIQKTISTINENMLKPEYKKFADAMNSLNSRNSNMKKTPLEALSELGQRIPNYIIKDNEDIDFMRSAYETTEEREITVLENILVNSANMSNRTVSKEAEKNRADNEKEKI